jgi:Short C-terminal domain
MSEGPSTIDQPEGSGPGDAAQAEVRGRADRGTPPPGPTATASISRRRLVIVDVLIAITTVLAVVGMFSVYANRLLFNPDNWANTSTQLLQNSTIRNETANYLVDQLYANVNVAGLLKSGLPPRLGPLAGPAAGALQNAAVQGVELALSRPRVQTLWASANRAADQTFIAIVNGGKGAVKVNGGAVTLDLASIVDTVAARLGLPANLGAKLPASVANLTVFKSDQLKYVQTGGKAVKGLALWLTIFVPLLYALAIFIARGHRRRTLMTVGFAIVFAGVVGWAGRSVLQSQVTNGLVSDASLRPAVHAVLVIATGLLGQIIGAFILVGLVVVAAAWFAGPARVSVAARRSIAPFLREQPVGTFAIAAGLMVLIFIWDPIPATGTPVGIIVFLLLALFGTEMLRRQTAVEFPDARPGDATAAMRARMNAFRERRQRNKGSAPNAPLADQLERLAALRARDEITAEEYNTAKATLLTTAR